MVIGDIVLRFGELERMLMTAHARIMGHDGLLEEIRTLKKQSNTLGALINKLKKEFTPNEYTWVDFDQLGKLNNMRNGLMHDSLVQQADGSLTWQSNSKPGKRQHRPVDYAELLLLRECLVRTITQINIGSLSVKKER